MLPEEVLEIIQRLCEDRNDALLYAVFLDEAEKLAKKDPSIVKWYKNVYKR